MATLRRLNFEDMTLIIFYFTLPSNNLFHDYKKSLVKDAKNLTCINLTKEDKLTPASSQINNANFLSENSHTLNVVVITVYSHATTLTLLNYKEFLSIQKEQVSN